MSEVVTGVKGVPEACLHNAAIASCPDAMQVRPDHAGAMVRKSILLGLLCTVTAFANCRAAQMVVSVVDARGRPVPDAVVIATAQDAARQPAAAPAPAVMDQVKKAFVPSVLVVRTGTPVIFPNSDVIAHQVYSFSSPKRFELGLYRGHPHAPIVLDRAGLIVLGCNIHDNMVGYIVVTDSPYFGKSDDRGVLRISELPAAAYDVSVWSPGLPRDAGEVKQQIVLTDGAPGRAEFRLKEALRASADANSDARIRDY